MSVSVDENMHHCTFMHYHIAISCNSIASQIYHEIYIKNKRFQFWWNCVQPSSIYYRSAIKDNPICYGKGVIQKYASPKSKGWKNNCCSSSCCILKTTQAHWIQIKEKQLYKEYVKSQFMLSPEAQRTNKQTIKIQQKSNINENKKFSNVYCIKIFIRK